MLLDQQQNLNPRSSPTHLLWCFLEVFSAEGGIQSFVKDIFKAYLDITESNAGQAGKPQWQSDVLLLRDAPGFQNRFENSSLNFYYLQSKSAQVGRLKLALSLLKGLIQKRPKRVICGHINLAPLVNVFCQPLGIPYIIFTHGKEIWEPLPPAYQKAMRQAEQICSVSRYTRDRASKANHLDPNLFRLMPCMVDGEKFTPGPKPQALIQRYGLQNAQVLMTVTRLWSGDPYKGVDMTIEALSRVSEVIPNVKYLVVGRGDDRPRLEKLAEDHGVKDRVIFAGFVPGEELVDHYRVADAYCMPSQEGFGIVYLEAMACGIPVLSGDADGSADPLQDGQLGWRVPYRDPKAVAEACIEMLQGEDPRCNGEWLRQQTLALFGYEAFRMRLQELLNS